MATDAAAATDIPFFPSYGYVGAPANFNGTYPDGGDSSMD